MSTRFAFFGPLDRSTTTNATMWTRTYIHQIHDEKRNDEDDAQQIHHNVIKQKPKKGNKNCREADGGVREGEKEWGIEWQISDARGRRLTMFLCGPMTHQWQHNERLIGRLKCNDRFVDGDDGRGIADVDRSEFYLRIDLPVFRDQLHLQPLHVLRYRRNREKSSTTQYEKFTCDVRCSMSTNLFWELKSMATHFDSFTEVPWCSS